MEENAPPVVARRHSPETSRNIVSVSSLQGTKGSETGCLLKMHDVSLVPKRKEKEKDPNWLKTTGEIGLNTNSLQHIAPLCNSTDVEAGSEFSACGRARCKDDFESVAVGAECQRRGDFRRSEYRVSIELWKVVNSCDVGTSLRIFDDAYRSYMILPPHDLDRLKPIGELHHVFHVFLMAFQLCSIV